MTITVEMLRMQEMIFITECLPMRRFHSFLSHLLFKFNTDDDVTSKNIPSRTVTLKNAFSSILQTLPEIVSLFTAFIILWSVKIFVRPLEERKKIPRNVIERVEC